MSTQEPSYTQMAVTSDTDLQHNMNPWQPGVLRRIPWGGISCLLGVLCCGVVEIAILIASNGRPIVSWKYPPSLYLSIAYTIANILLAAAFSQGLTVYWWRKALKQGTQLGDLHRYWEHGTSPLAALLAGRTFNYISFAALFLAITPVNGPLLQRASSITTEQRHILSDEVHARLPAVTSITDPTGYTSGRTYSVTTLDAKFAPVVQAWSAGRSIIVNNTGCAGDGFCSGRLEAAGLAISCNSSTAEFDMSGATGDGKINQASLNGVDIFQLDLSWTAMQPSNITLNLQWKPEKDFAPGQLQVRNCTLGAATVQYPVTIDGNKSTIALHGHSSISDDVVLSLSASTSQTMYGLPSPIGGFAYALSSKLNSVTRLRFAGAAGYELTSVGATASQFADMSEVTGYITDMGHTKFSDPSDYIFEQARELMFRTALAQGTPSTMQDLQQATELRIVTVYRSHFEYLAAAVGLTFIAMGIVLATFNGFWLLGRNVTMSPIETAKAFNAPLLAHEHPNAEVRDLVKGAGNKPVRYGEVIATDMMRDETSIYKGAETGTGTDTIELRQFHVGFEHPSHVQPLSKRRR